MSLRDEMLAAGRGKSGPGAGAVREQMLRFGASRLREQMLRFGASRLREEKALRSGVSTGAQPAAERLPVPQPAPAAGPEPRLRLAAGASPIPAPTPALTPGPQPRPRLAAGPSPIPVPTPTPEPTPAVAAQRLQAGIERPAAAPRPSKPFSWPRAARLAYQGIVRRGPTSFYDYLNAVANRIADATGADRGSTFKLIADLSRLPPEQVVHPENLAERIVGRVAQATTGDLPLAALALAGGGAEAGFAGLGALSAWVANKGIYGIVSEAIKGAVTGRLLTGTGILARAPRAGAQFAIGAAGAAGHPGAKPEEIVAEGATLAALGLPGKSGPLRLRDIVVTQIAKARMRRIRRAMAEAGIGPIEPGEINMLGASDRRQRFRARFRTAELDELATNDPEVQPRDRSTAPSRAQVDSLRRQFDADAYLAGDRELKFGPAIVGPDLKVESGNGRIEALRQLRQFEPERYREVMDQMRRRAADYGLDPRAFGPDTVIVRERLDTTQELAGKLGVKPAEARRAFAVEANRDPSLARPAAERATEDAARIGGAVLDALDMGGASTLEAALSAVRNRPAVHAFVDRIPPAERGDLMDRSGTQLSLEGIRRLKMALMRYTFGQEAGERLVRSLAERPEPNIRNAEAALLASVIDLAKLKRLAPEFDLTPEIAHALDELVRFRRAGLSLNEYLGQRSLPGERELDETGQALLRLFAEARYPKPIRDTLGAYARFAKETPGAEQGTFGGMGGARPTKADLFRRARRWVLEGGAEPELGGAKEAEIGRFERTGKPIEPGERGIGRPEQITGPRKPEKPLRRLPAGAPERLGGHRFSIGPLFRRLMGRFHSNAEARTELKRRSEIVGELSRKLQLPIRWGLAGHRKKGMLGFLDPRRRVAHIREPFDMPSIFHEAAHLLDQLLFYPRGRPGGPALEQFADELEPLATQATAASSPLAEGLAEFVSKYVTKPGAAAEAAPKFNRWFEETLRNEHPDALDLLLDSRKALRMWDESPATARVAARMGISDNASRGISISDLRSQAVDDLHFVRLYRDAVSGPGKPPAFLDDPYVLMRVYRDWLGKVQEFLEYGTFSFKTYKPTGPSFNSILKRVEGREDRFEAWLLARQSMNRLERGKKPQIPLEEARQVLAENRAEGFAEIARDLYRYQEALLEYLVDAQVITATQRSRLSPLLNDYVPVYKIVEQELPPELRAAHRGRAFTEIFDPVRRMGPAESGLEIVHPLESIIKNTYAFIAMAERNAVMNALVDLAGRTGGNAWVVEYEAPKMRPIPITDRDVRRILKKYGRTVRETTVRPGQPKRTVEEQRRTTVVGERGPEELTKSEQHIDRLVREALGARGLGRGEVDQIVRRLRESAAKGGRDLNTEITKIITETRTDVVHTVESTDLSDLPPTIIEIFRPSYRVPANLPVIRVMRHGLPRLYLLNADLYRAVAGLDRGEIGDLVKLLSAPARVLRAGAVTGLEFGVRNPVRDQFDAFMLSKYGYVPGYDLIRGLSALGVFKGKTGETETSRLMRIGGVGGAVLVALDRRYLGQDLSRLQARPSKWANVRRLANPVRAARVLSETMELATRAAEFKRALEVEGRGKEGILRATMAARRVTTDYGVMGANGVIRGLAMLTPFMNARIQHTDRLIQAFREEPRRTTIRAVLGATLPSMLLYAANHDDPRYQQLDWYERDLFFTIIPRPISRADWDRLTLEQQRIKSQETIWKIPKGLLGILFGSSVERTLDYMRGQDPKAFTEWARSFLSEVNPLDVPAFARGVLGAYYDYDSFFNRPIDPPGRVGLDPSERYWPWTSELAKSLGGALGVSPAKLDFLWISQTGGLGRLGLDAVDFAFRTARRALPGAEVPIKARRTLADVPGLRAFVIRWPKQRTRAVREFYELRNQAAQRYHTWRNIKDKAARARYAQQHRFLIGVAPPLEKTARQISDGAGDARDLVQGTPQLSPEQKRNALDSIALQVNEAARRALEHARALRERLSQPTRLSQPLEAGSPGIGGRTEPPRSIPRNAQPLRAAP